MTAVLSDWVKPMRVHALQTTSRLNARDGSVINPFDVHPNHPSAQAQLSALKHAFDLPHPVYFLQQVHGNQVVEYTQTPKRHFSQQADACFTRKSKVICAVMTADCLPILLTDVSGAFVAAIHCGWRSLYANIIKQTLEQIAPQSEVLAWLGPCIQVNDYEVGNEFKAHYLNAHPNAESGFCTQANGAIHANLPELARTQLETLGVTRIHTNTDSTYSNEAYHSWRQDQTSQRMASMLWLNP